MYWRKCLSLLQVPQLPSTPLSNRESKSKQQEKLSESLSLRLSFQRLSSMNTEAHLSTYSFFHSPSIPYSLFYILIFHLKCNLMIFPDYFLKSFSCKIQFNQFSVDEHLGYFPSFAMKNNIACVIFHTGKYIYNSFLEVESQCQRTIPL